MSSSLTCSCAVGRLRLLFCLPDYFWGRIPVGHQRVKEQRCIATVGIFSSKPGNTTATDILHILCVCVRTTRLEYTFGVHTCIVLFPLTRPLIIHTPINNTQAQRHTLPHTHTRAHTQETEYKHQCVFMVTLSEGPVLTREDAAWLPPPPSHVPESPSRRRASLPLDYHSPSSPDRKSVV